MRKKPPVRPKKSSKRTKNARNHPLFAPPEKMQENASKRLLSELEADFKQEKVMKTPVKTRNYTSQIIADILGVSKSLVHKVRYGDRDNDKVLDTVLEYNDRHNRIVEDLTKREQLYKLAEATGGIEHAQGFEAFCDDMRERLEKVIDNLYEQIKREIIDQWDDNEN